MFKSFFFLTLITFCFNSTFSQEELAPSEEKGIYERVANVKLHTTVGDKQFSEIYDQSPVLLAMIFTNCTGVCMPFLANLDREVKALGREDFQIVVVSFDPADSVMHMKMLAERYKLQDNKRWIFATADDIEALNESIDFKPIWDEGRKQFDHDALLVGINLNGYITKKLIGIRDGKALLSVVKDINNEFILSYPEPGKEASITCFTFDPRTGEKKWAYGMFFMLLPAFLTVIVVFVVSRIIRNKKLKEDSI